MDVRPVYRGPGSNAGAQDFAAEIAGIDLSEPIDEAAVRAIWDAIDRYCRAGVPRPAADRRAVARLRRRVRSAGDRPRRVARRQAAAGNSADRRYFQPRRGQPGARPRAIGGGSTASATGCGTPMRRTCRCRWCWACCTRSPCLRRARSAAARPSSPTCARRTMRCREATRAEIDGLVVEHDIFWSRGQIGFTAFQPGERREVSALAADAWCAGIRDRGRKTLYLVGARLAYRRLAGRGRAVAVART